MNDCACKDRTIYTCSHVLSFRMHVSYVYVFVLFVYITVIIANELYTYRLRILVCVCIHVFVFMLLCDICKIVFTVGLTNLSLHLV